MPTDEQFAYSAFMYGVHEEANMPTLQRHFVVGDQVRKIKGYSWPGIVVSTFQTLSGQHRYVVECTTPEVKGALHIYNGEQLELASE
jgi:hypothetical protein